MSLRYPVGHAAPARSLPVRHRASARPRSELLAVVPQTPAPATPAAAAFADAVKLHDAGKFADAIPLFQRAIALGYQPINQARFRLARAYARAGQPDAALAELDTLAAAGFANVGVLTDARSRQPARPAALQGLRRARERQRAPVRRRPELSARLISGSANGTCSRPDRPAARSARARPASSSASSTAASSRRTGCPIGGVGAGKSFNIYNTVTKQWEQYYVDARGTITHYTGAFHDDGHLYFEATQFGTTNRLRMTFFNQGPSEVRQLGHIVDRRRQDVDGVVRPDVPAEEIETPQPCHPMRGSSSTAASIIPQTMVLTAMVWAPPRRVSQVSLAPQTPLTTTSPTAQRYRAAPTNWRGCRASRASMR